jgi:hypothetical protein
MSTEIEVGEDESMVDVLKRLEEMNRVEYANAPTTLEEAIEKEAAKFEDLEKYLTLMVEGQVIKEGEPLLFSAA